MNTNTLNIVAAATFSVAMAGISDAQTFPRYSARLVGTSGAAAMNESGLVVGFSSDTGAQRAWVAGERFGLLPLPAGMLSSAAFDVNEFGEIVGAVGPFDYSVEFSGQPALWTPDGQGGYTVEVLGSLPGQTLGWARAINNIGDIVGTATVGGYRRPVLYDGSNAPTDLSPTGIFDPVGINDSREVVDQSFTAKRLDLNTMMVQDLGKPDGSFSGTRAISINAFGQVAGTAVQSCCASCPYITTRYTDGIGWETYLSCGTRNGANDINDLGDFVSWQNTYAGVYLEGVGFTALEGLIDESGGHWYVYGATAINSKRQIAAFASNALTGEAGTVLLTPVGNHPWLAVSNLVRGQTATTTLTGAEADDDVVFLYTRSGIGQGPCPAVFGGLCLDLLNPVQLLGRTRADMGGSARIEYTIPAGAPRVLIYQQAVVRRGTGGADSVKSNAVTAAIE